eukprot:245868_1
MEALGYTATLDIPMNLLAPALIQVRPDAKVLWNYRASGVDEWYESLAFINEIAEPLFYARPWKWIMPNPSKRMRPLIKILASVSQPDLTYPDHLERPLPWYERLQDTQYPMIHGRFRENGHPLRSDKRIKRRWMSVYVNFPQRLQRELSELKGPNALKAQYLEYTVQEGWGPLLDFLLDKEDGQQEL